MLPTFERRNEVAFLCITQSQPTKHPCICTCCLQLPTVTPQLICCHPGPGCELKLPCLNMSPCPKCSVCLVFLHFFSRRTLSHEMITPCAQIFQAREQLWSLNIENLIFFTVSDTARMELFKSSTAANPNKTLKKAFP